MLLWCGISMAARDIPALETGQTEVFLFLWDLCISGADRDDGSLAVEKENTDLALNGAMAVIVLFFCVWILAALLEPFFTGCQAGIS